MDVLTRIRTELLDQRERIDQAINALGGPLTNTEPSMGLPKPHWTQQPKNHKKLLKVLRGMRTAKNGKH